VEPYNGPSINEVFDSLTTNDAPVARLFRDDARTAEVEAALRGAPHLEQARYMAGGLYGNRQADKKVVLEPGGTPLMLPARDFVRAPDLVDWQQGNGGKKMIGASAEPSAKVIRRYARMPTAAPPIGEVIGYVQPNNLTLYTLVGNGAHRTAAAIARGDDYITVGGQVVLYQLPENIVELPAGSAPEPLTEA